MHTDRARPAFLSAFTAHPATVGESYWQHMAFAGRFAGLLALAAGAALVHAVLPMLFDKTASRIVTRLHARITMR